MPWISPPSRSRGRHGPSYPVLGGAIVGIGLLVGCHQFPDVFLDDLPDSAMVTTMSARRAIEVPVSPTVRQREFSPMHVEPQDGTVAHAPLWFEDPFEMAGSDDGQFAVTWEDVLYFPIGICRFIANFGLLPVSMLLEPAGTLICSDGVERRAYDTGTPMPYDAERCAGITTPPDVHETWTFDDEFENAEPSMDESETTEPPASSNPTDGNQPP